MCVMWSSSYIEIDAIELLWIDHNLQKNYSYVVHVFAGLCQPLSERSTLLPTQVAVLPWRQRAL